MCTCQLSKAAPSQLTTMILCGRWSGSQQIRGGSARRITAAEAAAAVAATGDGGEGGSRPQGGRPARAAGAPAALWPPGPGASMRTSVTLHGDLTYFRDTRSSDVHVATIMPHLLLPALANVQMFLRA